MKIVIVTGSSRGIGASTALECAKRGMGVVVTYNTNPDEVGGVIASLLSEENRWINAQNIEVAGGYII